MKNSLCNLCNIEDYSHYFMTYIFFQKVFWGNNRRIKKSGIENDITLYHFVFALKQNISSWRL